MKAGILARYADRQMPRYTSYPAAPHSSRWARKIIAYG